MEHHIAGEPGWEEGDEPDDPLLRQVPQTNPDLRPNDSMQARLLSWLCQARGEGVPQV